MTISEKSLNKLDVISYLNLQIDRFKQINQSTYSSLNSAYAASLNVKGEDDRHLHLRASCVAIFSNILAKSVGDIADTEARRAWEFVN